MPSLVTPKPILAEERPSRFRLTYAFELIVIGRQDGAVNDGATRVVNLHMNPEDYEVTEQAATEVQPTFGGVAVDDSGFLLRECKVSGRSGTDTMRGWGAGTLEQRGGMITADGNTLFRELRSLFRIYGELRQTPSAAHESLLVWHDFRNDDHWIIVPTGTCQRL